MSTTEQDALTVTQDATSVTRSDPPHLSHEAVQKAVAALSDPTVETFTRAQVAHIIALAIDAGTVHVLDAMSSQQQFQAGYDYAHGQFDAALIFAIGGPDARSYDEALTWYTRAINQRRARRQSDLSALVSRPGDYRGGPVEWDEPARMLRVAA